MNPPVGATATSRIGKVFVRTGQALGLCGKVKVDVPDERLERAVSNARAVEELHHTPGWNLYQQHRRTRRETLLHELVSNPGLATKPNEILGLQSRLQELDAEDRWFEEIEQQGRLAGERLAAKRDRIAGE